jgi:hypothetical protein
LKLKFIRRQPVNRALKITMNKLRNLNQSEPCRFLGHWRKTLIPLGMILFMAASVRGASISDFGTTAPALGANDVAQTTGGSDRDGLNYYADNSSPPGQTFITGSNPSGYGLTALYVKTGGYDANNTGTAQSYTLRIYSVSGSSATLISTYVTDNLLGFTDGTWLKYTGLTNILQPNTVYAYTHQRNTVGWDGMTAVTGNPYSGGEICLIPTAGGAITYGPSHNPDAAFVASLSPITDPFVFPTYINPSSAISGSSVTVSAGVGSGTQPIHYQWQFIGTNGTGTNILNATNISYTIASAQVSDQGGYRLIASNAPAGTPTVITNASASLVVRAAYTISTVGTTAPTPGASDIAQLTAGTDLDGLNYFADNASPPGQTFTTGSNPSGYTLTAIYLKTAGVNSSATGTQKTYTLRLYSVSSGTATLISAYLTDNTVGFTDGDWLRYTGMTNVLQPNTVYAYTHRQNGSGWDQLSAVLGDTYSGGQACLIPTGGGAISFGSSGSLDAAFQISLVPNGFAAIQNVGISPANSAGNPVYTPTPVLLTVQASGASPLHYEWQTDNGSAGATWIALPNSNTNSYALDTSAISPGTYQYQVIVTNANNAATSSIVTLNLSAASSPVLLNDTTVNPSALFVGGSAQFNATFSGSAPITYQWMFDKGTGAVAIAGATNSSYTIVSAQLTNSGSYFLIASNSISPYINTTTPVNLLVGRLPQNNTVSAGMFDATGSTPTPGTNDIAQLKTVFPSSVPGINYYVNNDSPAGQTFTTGNATNGYQLKSIYLQQEFGTIGNSGDTNATYTLRIYSISGVNAALITSYVSTNTPSIIAGDWIQWVGLTNVLAPNSAYAFSIHKDTGSGWWGLGNDYSSGDLYAGGQAALLPTSGAGAVTYSTDPSIDAAFLIALAPATASTINANPTNLTFSVNGNTLALSWPADRLGWVVQSNALNIANPGAWYDVPNSQNATNLNITLGATNNVFFRLRYPQ